MTVRLPDFAVIGAMKCGTSTLHEQLAARSGIFMSEPKEPNFFSDDDVFARGLPAYAALFAAADPGQICGESSTHYTKLPDRPHTVERFRAALPDARVVYVVRDPIERVVSQYVHEWTQNEVRGPIDRVVREMPRFAAYSAYHMQVEPWLRAFGPERVLLVVMEQIFARPDDELSRVLRFLGDPSPEPPRWQDLGARNVSRDRVRKAGLYLRLREAAGALGLRARLPEAWKGRVRSLWQMRERPVLAEATRRFLVERLDPDLAALGERVGRPLSCAAWADLARAPTLEWRDAAATVPEAEPGLREHGA